MLPAVNRAKVSEHEVAIAYRGLDEVERHWDPGGWMRGRDRYKFAVPNPVRRSRRISLAVLRHVPENLPSLVEPEVGFGC